MKILAALHEQLQWYWSDSDPMTDDIVVKEQVNQCKEMLAAALPPPCNAATGTAQQPPLKGKSKVLHMDRAVLAKP